jgi:hypothetical protein
MIALMVVGLTGLAAALLLPAKVERPEGVDLSPRPAPEVRS